MRNQFGGSLGGPLKKEKMFLFGAVEIHRLRQTYPITTTGIRQEFINWVDSGGMADFYGLDCADPDQAKACTLGPVFKDLNSRFPMPVSTKPVTDNDYVSTSPILGGTPYPVPIFGDVTLQNRIRANQNRWNLKWDYQATSKDTITAHYVFDDFDEYDSTGGGDAYNPAFGFDAPARSQNGSVGWTRTFAPTVVNEFRAAYLRHNAPFPRSTAPEVPSIFTIDALGTGYGITSSLPQNFTENTFQYQDSMSWIRGRHTLRFGGDYRRTRNGSAFEAARDGVFYFWDTESMLTDGALVDLFGLGGFYLAEASIDPNSTTPKRPEYYRGFRANEFSWFVEDSWKVNNRLTFTLGMRYDYFGIPHNFRSGLDSNFYFGSHNLDQCIIRKATGAEVCLPGDGVTNPVSTNPYFPVNAYTASVFGGDFKQKNSGIWNKDSNNFAPRFGLAWDVRGNQKTVIRLGGGVFYDRMWNNLFENIRFNPPSFAFADWGYAGNGLTVGPISTPGFYSIPIDIANFAGTAATPGPRHMNEGMVTAYSEQYNFNIQRQLSTNWLLDMAYVATVAHKLTGVVNVNTFNGRSGFGYSSRRINPNIGSDNMRGNWYNSNYHALQVRLTKRMSRGITIDTNYTYSHALDFISDAFNNRSGNDFRPENQWNRGLEYGAADFDLRHRFLTSFVWDLPFFKSNKILGGWTVNGVVTLQTGTPFTIYDSSNDVNGDGLFSDRAAFYGGAGAKPSGYIDHSQSPADGYLANPLTNKGTNPWTGAPISVFDTTVADFVNGASEPVDGYMSRNAMYGPGFANTDFSVSKKFRITEGTALTFVWSSFNLWNHPNFFMGISSGDVSGTSFGRSRSTISPNNTGGRVMQWALRFDF